MSLFSDLMNDESGELSSSSPPTAVFHSPKTKEPNITPFTPSAKTGKTTQVTKYEAYIMLTMAVGSVDGPDIWGESIPWLD